VPGASVRRARLGLEPDDAARSSARRRSNSPRWRPAGLERVEGRRRGAPRQRDRLLDAADDGHEARQALPEPDQVRGGQRARRAAPLPARAGRRRRHPRGRRARRARLRSCRCSASRSWRLSPRRRPRPERRAGRRGRSRRSRAPRRRRGPPPRSRPPRPRCPERGPAPDRGRSRRGPGGRGEGRRFAGRVAPGASPSPASPSATGRPCRRRSSRRDEDGLQRALVDVGPRQMAAARTRCCTARGAKINGCEEGHEAAPGVWSCGVGAPTRPCDTRARSR